MKTQILTLILVAVTSLSIGQPPLRDGQLLCNPSMDMPYQNYPDYGDVADCWTPWGWGTFDWGIYDLMNYPSQHVYYTGSGDDFYGPGGIYQAVNKLVPGQLYRFSYHTGFDGFITSEIPPDVYLFAELRFMNQVGVDTTGGTDPYNVTNWSPQRSYGMILGSYADFSSFGDAATVYFVADKKKATFFTRQTGILDATDYDYGYGPLDWEINWYIDDVELEPVEIGPQSSVEAIGPVKANGFDLCEVILTIMDQNGNPLQGVQPNDIYVECSGSGNTINMDDFLTSDNNGHLMFSISSTVAELKTISVWVFGTPLPETQIQFDEPDGWVRFQEITLPYQYSSKHPVVLDSNKAVIGCPDDSVGSAEIYSFDGSTWIKEAVLRPSITSDFSYFGAAVDLDGSHAIVSNTIDYYSNSGSVYVFEYNGNNWNEQTKLTNPGSSHSSFGESVAIHDNWAMVGAPQEPSDGAVFVYSHQDGLWSYHSTLTDPNNTYSDLGRCIALSQEWAAIGAYYTVILFHQENDTWVYKATLDPGGTIEDICLDGTMLYVAFEQNYTSFMLQGYHYDNGQWTLQDEWPFDGNSSYNLSITFSGLWGVAAQPSESYYYQGTVPVIFYRDASDWIPNAWLYPPVINEQPYTRFGDSVAINNDWILISSDGPQCYFLKKY